jgi:Reverse transcriptase (RNA-dependent DNA polymerase)
MLKSFFLKAIPNNIFDDQFAFRPTGSTTAVLSYMFHEATNALEYGNHIRCFLIDFIKAFDTVPYHQILGKLVNYNCPQVLINWIANYLTDRTQSVTCSSGCLLPLRITHSIIQCSGFGPAGFIAYNADLRPLNNENIFCKFADDLTTILVRTIQHLLNLHTYSIGLSKIKLKLIWTRLRRS